MRSACGDTSGLDNSSYGIYEGPLVALDTPPKTDKQVEMFSQKNSNLRLCPHMCADLWWNIVIWYKCCLFLFFF